MPLKSKKKKTKAVEPRKAGRPCMYKVEYCQKIIDIASMGGFLAQMCIGLKIDTKTFYNWKEKYPEFAEAHEIAKLHQKAHLEGVVLDLAKGEKKGSHQAAALLLRTKFKDEYVDETKPSVSYNIGSINNNFTNLSPQELDDRINLLLQKHQPQIEDKIVIEAEYQEIESQN